MASHQEVQTFMAGACFCFCSVGMLLFNKLAVHAFPLECTLVTLQMAFASLALLVFAWKSLHIGSFKDFMRWMVVAPFFSAMLLTSILALKNAPMSLVVVLRSLSPLGSLVVERFYPNPLEIDSNIILSIFVMFTGGCLYISQTEMHSQNIAGIMWVIVNSMVAVTERCLQRYMLAKEYDPVDISKTSLTLINNALGTIPLAIAAFATGELPQIPAAMASLTYLNKGIILLSCVIGVGIGYSGMWAQSLISATSFLVMINANKFAIILIEAFGMHTKSLSRIQILGAFLSIFGACFYGKARMDLEQRKQKKGLCESMDEKEPLLEPKQV